MSPHKKNAPAKGRSSKLRVISALARACQILRVVQRPSGWVFWALEQRIAEVDLEIERQGRS